MLRIVITGGPSSEPIDGVRLITNQSTGELAVLLAERFRESENDVELFLGRRSIFRTSWARLFDTNEALERLLGEVRKREGVQAVLHAAALADFEVANIVVEGQKQAVLKIPSAATAIQLRLVPKSKVIAQLRQLFPEAFIVGWKFELDGSPADVVSKGIQQIEKYATNACIVNGSAFGPGFGFCNRNGLICTVGSKPELVELLWKLVTTGSYPDARLR